MPGKLGISKFTTRTNKAAALLFYISAVPLFIFVLVSLPHGDINWSVSCDLIFEVMTCDFQQCGILTSVD